MRLIEKLMDKAKNRPRMEKTGLVSPFFLNGKWGCTVHWTHKGKCETEQETFETRAEAEAWGEEHVGKDGTLLIMCESEEDELCAE